MVKVSWMGCLVQFWFWWWKSQNVWTHLDGKYMVILIHLWYFGDMQPPIRRWIPQWTLYNVVLTYRMGPPSDVCWFINHYNPH
jgi:hypothetical protein